MKAFLAIIGGFVASLGMFIGGVLLATTFLTAEPAREPGPSGTVAAMWSAEPRVVDADAQDFERVSAIPQSAEWNDTAAADAESANAEAMAESQSPAVDIMTTASVQPEEEEAVEIQTVSVKPVTEEDRGETSPASRFPIAHVEWCANHYRSYRASDNSYQPYSGGRRACVSPYAGDVAGAAQTSSEEDYTVQTNDASYETVQYTSDETQSSVYITPEHVNDCFSRYRSYRPSDNTYQPYNGGPRRQCR